MKISAGAESTLLFTYQQPKQMHTWLLCLHVELFLRTAYIDYTSL